VSTITGTVPQPGHLYRYDDAVRREYLVFVTSAEVTAYAWVVTGYRVTAAYQMTGERVTESGSIGRPHGVPHKAFCAPAGIGGRDGQIPLFSDRFPASDASLVRGAEHAGRARLSKRTYQPVPGADVPQDIIWTTPRRNQGQTVEVSYSLGIPAGKTAGMEAGHGDPWMRETDHSDGTVTYFRYR
jgi:hypothetical protein